MMEMKWILDREGQLVATWKESHILALDLDQSFREGLVRTECGPGGPPGRRRGILQFMSIILTLVGSATGERLAQVLSIHRNRPKVAQDLDAHLRFRRSGWALLLALVVWSLNLFGQDADPAKPKAGTDGNSVVLALATSPTPGQDSPGPDQGQGSNDSPLPDRQRWNFHFQSTVGAQAHPSFAAEYTGPNSLTPGAQIKDTISVDATGGVRLWSGGEFFADLLMWQGFGLSNSLGAAGFPNAEAFRVGKTYPDVSLCRAYVRETIGLGGEKEAAADAPDELAGTKDVRRLTLTVGHFSAKDIFDNNAYSNDGRSQFMNWVLVANGAWDYPANTLGFTNGAAAELNTRAWAGRIGIFMVSKVANGLRMDWNLAHAWSSVAEVERRYSPRGHAGTLRLLAYDTRAHMGNYQATIDNPRFDEIVSLTAAYRYKYGFGINLEQEIRKNLGAFARLGWSDGKNQTYEYTDVDRTATAGLSLKGTWWRRPEDTIGLAMIVNGISSVHRQYLAAGGLGITVGDGALDYRSERILEAYYNWRIAKHFQLTPDYQFAQNPAYNHARGPVSIFALRLHTEY